MKLTSHYKRTALFDSAVEYESYPGGEAHQFYFNIFPFEYVVTIVSKRNGVYYISFRLADITADPADAAEYLSQIRGEPVFPGEIEDFRRRLRNKGFDVMGVGNSPTVFATVIQIVKNFLKEEDPVCMKFSAAEPSRQKLYRGILRRVFPGYQVREETQERGISLFSVCKQALTA